MNLTTDFPTVSVIIPCYNSEKTIERCLQSVLAQKLTPSEILIYDDCSTDGTVDIISSYANDHANIGITLSNENRGAGVARTALLEKATGEYFAFLDADDVWNSDKLETQIKAMLDSSATICVCGYEIFNEQGDQLGKRQPPQLITLRRMHLANWIPTSMAVVKADLVGTRAMPKIRRRQDYAYWLNMFKKNEGVTCLTLEGIYGSYYRNDGSLSSNWRNNLAANYAMFRHTLGYSVVFSAMYVCANIATRLLRT